MDKKIENGPVESWSGLDLTLNRPVTIRITDTGTEIGQRVRMQAQAISRLSHHYLLLPIRFSSPYHQIFFAKLLYLL